MKNLVKLTTPAEIRKYVTDLWQTELFRTSPYVANWVERFCDRRGWVFAEMSEPQLEYAHFGTWFGLTYLRHYDNSIVSDLYYLHEIVHAVLAKYDSNDSFTSWYRRVNNTEFNASLETESYVYLEIPGLREISFTDQIWADRFLGDRLGKDELKNLMRQERYRAIREPDPMDYCEQQIAAYARQNFEWANIWKLNATASTWEPIPAFKLVEDHMMWFRSGQYVMMSIDDHVNWLQAMGDVPFPDQARLFSDVYWRNKLGYRKE